MKLPLFLVFLFFAVNAAAAKKFETYTLKKGEGIYEAAEFFGASIPQILEWNEDIEDPDYLSPGQKIKGKKNSLKFKKDEREKKVESIKDSTEKEVPVFKIEEIPRETKEASFPSLQEEKREETKNKKISKERHLLISLEILIGGLIVAIFAAWVLIGKFFRKPKINTQFPEDQEIKKPLLDLEEKMEPSPENNPLITFDSKKSNNITFIGRERIKFKYKEGGAKIKWYAYEAKAYLKKDINGQEIKVYESLWPIPNKEEVSGILLSKPSIYESVEKAFAKYQKVKLLGLENYLDSLQDQSKREEVREQMLRLITLKEKISKEKFLLENLDGTKTEMSVLRMVSPDLVLTK